MVLLFLIVEEIFKKQIYCCESELNKQKVIQTNPKFRRYIFGTLSEGKDCVKRKK
jgi:hypothetical protein